ncbi:unnamed protein product, partial [Symbiodinium sp. CCMP2592]
ASPAKKFDPDAPDDSAEPFQIDDLDADDDFWHEATKKDPDRVPAVNEAWANVEIVTLSVEPDAERDILEWEGVGWKATKPHGYYKDAAAEGALSYLTWGHGTDWKSLPYILREGLVRPRGRRAAKQWILHSGPQPGVV